MSDNKIKIIIKNLCELKGNFEYMKHNSADKYKSEFEWKCIALQWAIDIVNNVNNNYKENQ